MSTHADHVDASAAAVAGVAPAETAPPYADNADKLKDACQRGSITHVRELLAVQGPEALVYIHLWKAFTGACEAEQLDLVRELLAVTDHRAITAFTLKSQYDAAVAKGKMALRDALLASGNTALQDLIRQAEAFRAACSAGDLDAIKAMLGDQESAVVASADVIAALQDPTVLQRPDIARELLAEQNKPAIHGRLFLDRLLETSIEQRCSLDVLRVLLPTLLAETGSCALDACKVRNAFQTACEQDTAELAAELLTVDGERAVPADTASRTFTTACKREQLNVVRLLLGVTGARAIPAAAVKAAHAAAVAGGKDALADLLATEGEARLEAVAATGGEFVAACRAGNVDTVRELLAVQGEGAVDGDAVEAALKDPDVLQHESVVCTLLALEEKRAPDDEVVCELFETAAEEGFVEVLRALLVHQSALLETHTVQGSDVMSAFDVAAAASGRGKVLRELLAVEGERAVSATSIRLAANSVWINGNVDTLRELLAVQGERALDVATCTKGLASACRAGHLGVVRELLALTGDRAVDVHAQNEGAFFAACARGHLDVVLELLALTGDRAIDVNANSSIAFCAACMHGHVAVVRELLALPEDRAVDVHARSEGAFQKACKGGHVDIVRELLSLTGDRAIPAAAVEAARAAAAEGGQEAVVEVLAAHSQ